jgi:N-methylhydantoinase A/oxoprolinase/acetone carboxylase beta subunit
MRSGLTPTDIMHLTGDFTGWQKDAAVLGIEILARRLNKDVDVFINEVNQMIKEKLYINIVKMLLDLEEPHILKTEEMAKLEKIISMSFKPGKYISCNFKTDFALIGIGAPIHVYLPDVAAVLNTKCIIPEKASVANAIGAITGNIMVEERVVIKPRYTVAGIEGYDCFSSRIKQYFENYAEAVEWAKQEAEALARQSALDRGAGEINIAVDVSENDATINVYDEMGEDEEKQIQQQSRSKKLLLETLVLAHASGGVKWMEREATKS